MPSKTAATKARAPRARQPKEVEAGPPARLVDGHKVVEERRVMGGLNGKDGDKIPLRMNELFLDDGTKRFACIDCGHVEDSVGLMRRHRVAAHGNKPTGRKPAVSGLPDSVRAMTLGELIDLACQADITGELVSTLTEQVFFERARANDAESALRRLRAALSRAGFKLAEAEA